MIAYFSFGHPVSQKLVDYLGDGKSPSKIYTCDI